MIYLLDHQQKRQEDFGIRKYISNYEEVVTLYHEKEKIKTDTAPLVLSDFPNATCFLLHLSFKKDKVAEDIVEIAKENEIPIAIFTNQPNENIILDESSKVLRVSSTLFYKTLESFLEHYKFKDKIDLSLLYYPDEIKTQITILVNNFKKLFLTKKDEEIIEVKSPSAEKQLEKIFTLLNKEEELSNFIEQIENSEISKYSFFQKII